MKKSFHLLVLSAFLVLSGCDNSKQELEKVRAELGVAKAELGTTKVALTTAMGDLSQARAEIERLKSIKLPTLEKVPAKADIQHTGSDAKRVAQTKKAAAEKSKADANKAAAEKAAAAKPCSKEAAINEKKEALETKMREYNARLLVFGRLKTHEEKIIAAPLVLKSEKQKDKLEADIKALEQQCLKEQSSTAK